MPPPELRMPQETGVIGPKAPKQPKKIPAANRRMVEDRSGGVCESCGDRPASDIHHRQYLSRGGTHDVENLIHLCGFGNTSGCHGRAHRDGRQEGLSISRYARVEMTPVLYRGAWAFLRDEGVVEPVNESVADMLRGGLVG